MLFHPAFVGGCWREIPLSFGPLGFLNCYGGVFLDEVPLFSFCMPFSVAQRRSASERERERERGFFLEKGSLHLRAKPAVVFLESRPGVGTRDQGVFESLFGAFSSGT